MGKTKHYGILDGIAQEEPGSIAGNLSITGILAESQHCPPSMICVGSTGTSAVDLAQLALTAEQAIKLGTLIVSAGQDALEANRRVENLRRHGPAAMRLCFALAEGDAQDVLVDQSRIRLGYSLEAQRLAEDAYLTDPTIADSDWRQWWRDAGERLKKELGHG